MYFPSPVVFTSIGFSDPPKSALLKNAATGGFSDDVKAALRAAPALAGKIADLLLERHFPETLHPDILQAVGLDLTPQAPDRRRDPTFRKRVLTAYEYRCAVCGFDVRLAGVSVALDAAHIRWVQAADPDEEPNGLALCVLHDKLFDLGAFTRLIRTAGCSVAHPSGIGFEAWTAEIVHPGDLGNFGRMTGCVDYGGKCAVLGTDQPFTTL